MNQFFWRKLTGEIKFDMNHGSLLGTLVPNVGVPAALPAALHGRAIYLIVNSHTNTRYVGKTKSLSKRFKTRLGVIAEMGFSVAQLDQISAYWGRVSTKNSAAGSPWVAAPLAGYGGNHTLTGSVDGIPISLEKLFVRYMLYGFVGGFVSNNIFAGGGASYTNPTANDIDVEFNWAAGGYYAAGSHVETWATGPGGAW